MFITHYSFAHTLNVGLKFLWIKHFLKQIFYTLFFLLTVFNTPAAITKTINPIRCRVLDSWSNEGVPSAKIAGRNIFTVTDSLGYFYLSPDLNQGVILITKAAYFSKSIQLAELLITKLIFLQPEMVSDTIMVLSSKPFLSELDISSLISHLKEEDFSHQENIAELLAQHGGIYIKRYGGQEATHSISLRGLGAEQTLVALDGIPLNRSQSGTVDIEDYYLENFTNVDIYRGGLSTLFGSGAVGGVINLHLAQDWHKSISISTEKGSFGRNSVSGTLKLPTGKFKHTLHLRRNYSANQYEFLLNGNSGKRNNSDFSKSGLNYMTTYHHSLNNVFLFHILYDRDKHGVPRSIVDYSDYQGQARMKDEEWIIRLKWNYQYSKSLDLSTQVYLRRDWLDYRDDDIFISSRHVNDDSGIMFKIRADISEKVHILSGLETTLSRVKSTEAGNHRRERVALYSLLSWIMQQQNDFNLNMNIGVRYEFYSEFGDIFLPRMGVNIQMGKWNMFISMGKNYRSPTLNELYWEPGGNADLMAENSTALEGGIRYVNRGPINLDGSVNLYHTQLENMIRWFPTTSGIWQPQNLDQVLSRGVEMQLKYSLFNRFLNGFTYYKYGFIIKEKSNIPDDPTDGNRLPNVPSTELKTHLYATYKYFRLGFEADYMSFRYISLANDKNQFLPGVTVFNSFSDVCFYLSGIKFQFYFRVNNIFKKEYQMISNYPLPLQIWKIGLKFNLDNFNS